MKMSVGVLDHYNVSTRKLEETVHFYENVLGLHQRATPSIQFPRSLALQLWPSRAAPQRHLHRPRSSSVPIQASSIMSLSAAAASRQRSGISPKRESRTT